MRVSRSNQGPRIDRGRWGLEGVRGKGMGRIGSSRKREVWRNWGNERVRRAMGKSCFRAEGERKGWNRRRGGGGERQFFGISGRRKGFLLSNGKETRERSAIISEDADGLIWFADRSASIRERTAVDSVVIKGIEWRTE